MVLLIPRSIQLEPLATAGGTMQLLETEGTTQSNASWVNQKEMADLTNLVRL